jgi:U3 small nucleolar RNA-associated protein 13
MVPHATPQPPPKPRLKESYTRERHYGPTFTGGTVCLSPDAKLLYSTVNDSIAVVDLASGATLRTLQPSAEGDTVTSFAVCPDGSRLACAVSSLQIVVVDAATGAKLRAWKAHEAPILSMDIESTSTLVATASADSTVKVWDLEGAFCTHNFRGHSGVVACVKWDGLTLASGGEDGAVKVWDLHKRKCAADLRNHMSVVRGLAFVGESPGTAEPPSDTPLRTLVSAGRDKVLCVWDLPSRKLDRVIPVYDVLEGVVPLSGSHVACGGEKGTVYCIDVRDSNVSGHEFRPNTSVGVANAGHAIVQLVLPPPLPLPLPPSLEAGACLGVVTSDRNIYFLDPHDGMSKSKQVVGFNDEIVDARFCGSDMQYIAVATNAPEVCLSTDLPSPWIDWSRV